MRFSRTSVLLLAAALALTACGSAPADPPADAGGTAAAAADDGLVACADLANSELAEAARAEGVVVVTGPPTPQVREAVEPTFEAEMGISVEWLGSRSSEIVAQLQSERAAGLYTLDVLIGGVATLTNSFIANGWIANMSEALVGREILDEGLYLEGELPWLDDTEQLAMYSSDYRSGHVVINTDLVQDGELQSWDDFLDPKWKGQIIADDPRVAGSGDVVAGMLLNTEAYGEDFVRDLYVGQDVAISRDYRQQIDQVASGAVAIGLATRVEEVETAIADGLPVAIITPEGAAARVHGNTVIGMWDQGPNPNAAALMANWLLCPAGNQLLNESSFTASVRNDVEDGSPAYVQIDPDLEYFLPHSWEFVSNNGHDRVHEAMEGILGPA